MTQATYQGSPLQNGSSGSAPLVTLFERNDAIAVPLLSQLRMAGYDVRASRTPVELFDTLSKSLVSLVLVDLGAATAGRREFWVALDAQRRGRAIQVMTFRVIGPHGDLDLDSEPSARAIADIEAHGVHEFNRIIDGVRQRVPLHGVHGAPAAPGFGHPGLGQQGFSPVGAPGFPGQYSPPGSIQPLGAALGLAPTPFAAQNAHVFNAPAAAPAGWGGIAPLGVSPWEQAATPFPPSQPQQGSYNGYGAYDPMAPLAPMNPMSPMGGPAGQMQPYDPQFGIPSSPFDQAANAPYSVPLANPNGFNGMPGMGNMGGMGAPNPGVSPFANPTPSNPFSSGSSPFAQPFQSNPFGGQASPLPSSAPLPPNAPMPMASQPGQPGSQIPPWQAWNAPSAPVSQPGLGGQASQTPNNPSSIPNYLGAYPPGMPPSYPPSSPSSIPPWGAGPTSFDSEPRFPNRGFDAIPTPPSLGAPSAPTFQDVWSPPTNEFEEAPTGVVPEISFQKPAAPSSAPQPSNPPEARFDPSSKFAASSQFVASSQFAASTWETRHEPAAAGVPVAPPAPPAAPVTPVAAAPITPLAAAAPAAPAEAYIPPQSVAEQAASKVPASVATPTENALGGVLVDGKLLDPDQFEMLKGVQAMLAGVNVHRKIGDLALQFKFLSSDQLFAALLVSRGLVSPQQIASLGRVKQELAASGVDNDLESLLVSFHILPADKVKEIRTELGR